VHWLNGRFNIQQPPIGIRRPSGFPLSLHV
jgi:hypothetical protein